MMKVPAASILVIDDNPGVVDILVTCLREEGYEVLGALTGDEGLKDFILSRADLVLLDIALPGAMNGIELLKRIRSIDPTGRVVMVTGNADPALAREAPRAWRDRLRRQAVRSRPPQASCRYGAPARSSRNLVLDPYRVGEPHARIT